MLETMEEKNEREEVTMAVISMKKLLEIGRASCRERV